jgi:hypothetical protein
VRSDGGCGLRCGGERGEQHQEGEEPSASEVFQRMASASFRCEIRMRQARAPASTRFVEHGKGL